ncbi:glycosyltransferase family protein [Patescibacteria group bacterium]|nr:glycosyltransferase family protein [Patescibacteria group bacterium]
MRHKLKSKNFPKICAIIEARIGSTRLPGKVLMPICGKPMLQHIIERLRFSKLINQIILAIPDTKENDILEEFALRNSIGCYRGSENEVLARIYLAAKENNCDVIVRITADNPLIDPEIIDLAIKKYLSARADYSSTFYPSRFLPIGLDAEVFNFHALEIAYKNAKKSHQREHVTPYFYEHPDVFKIISIKLPKHLENPKLRLTLDTKEDLELITKIYAKLYKTGSLFKTKEILDLFKVQPELKKINAHIIQKIK